MTEAEEKKAKKTTKNLTSEQLQKLQEEAEKKAKEAENNAKEAKREVTRLKKEVKRKAEQEAREKEQAEALKFYKERRPLLVALEATMQATFLQTPLTGKDGRVLKTVYDWMIDEYNNVFGKIKSAQKGTKKLAAGQG